MCFRYFCQHNPLFYHLNLIPCHYWSWRRNIYFLVNILVRNTFSMSKSRIKTKTVLTMTDMKESTELLVFKRQKVGYKVTVKISLCICVVLPWDELKFQCQSGFGAPADLNGGGGGGVQIRTTNTRPDVTCARALSLLLILVLTPRVFLRLL